MIRIFPSVCIILHAHALAACMYHPYVCIICAYLPNGGGRSGSIVRCEMHTFMLRSIRVAASHAPHSPVEFRWMRRQANRVLLVK